MKPRLLRILLALGGASGAGLGLAAATLGELPVPPAGWKDLNLFGWSLRVPTNFYAVHHQGIDSIGGTIAASGLRIFYIQSLGPGMPVGTGPTTAPEPPLSEGAASRWTVKGVPVNVTPLGGEEVRPFAVGLGLSVAWTDSVRTGHRLTLQGTCQDQAELIVLRRIYESFRPYRVTIAVPVPEPGSWREYRLDEGVTVRLPPDLVAPPTSGSPTCRFVGLRLDLHYSCDPGLTGRLFGPARSAPPAPTRFTNVVVDGLHAQRFARTAAIGTSTSGKDHVLGLKLSGLGRDRNLCVHLWTQCEDLADWPTAAAVLGSLRMGDPLRPVAVGKR
jgi:hypothetical protein